METFLDRITHLNTINIAVLICAVALIFATIYYFLWKNASTARAQLKRELAERKAQFADTRDKLILESGYANDLNVALEKANATIAGKNIELRTAREKIASLNDENTTIYANYVEASEELKRNGCALKYWQYFTRKILRISRSHLENIDAILKENLQSHSAARLALALESLEVILELNELTETHDIPQRIRDMRVNACAPSHLIPRLQRFIEDCEKILGPRFFATISRFEQPPLFAGSWAHLELALTAMLSNARKHSVESTPIEFELICAERRATFQVTNRCIAPIAENVIKAKNEMMTADHRQTRFDLYLIDQIAAGYRAIVKLENLRSAEDAQNSTVRCSFSFSLN